MGHFQPVIESVEALDEGTFPFNPFAPYPTILAPMSASQAKSVSSMAWEAGTVDRVAISTGPYCFVEGVSEERVAMEAVPDDWASAPEVDQRIWTWSP